MGGHTIMFVNVRTNALEGDAALIAARRLGYDVVLLCDRPPENCSPDLVDDIRLVDTYDRAEALEAGLELGRRVGARGVVTWSDRDVELTAALCEGLGLPGPSRDAARRTRDKYAMRTAMQGEPGCIPRFAHVGRLDDLRRAIRDIGVPGVLKPVGGAGSKGVLEVDDAGHAEELFRQAIAVTDPSVDPLFHDHPNELIYEELLDGTEHSVDGWVFDGQTISAGITDKWTTEPYHLEYQEVHPTALPGPQQQALLEITEKVVHCMKLDACTFHLEARMTADGPKLLEIAARVGGGHIASHLIPMATGTPFYENVIRVSTGNRPILGSDTGLVSGGRSLLAGSAGRFGGFDGLADVLRLPSVKHFSFETAHGADVALPPVEYMSSTLGSVLACAGSREAVCATLSDAARLARPQIHRGTDA